MEIAIVLIDDWSHKHISATIGSKEKSQRTWNRISHNVAHIDKTFATYLVFDMTIVFIAAVVILTDKTDAYQFAYLMLLAAFNSCSGYYLSHIKHLVLNLLPYLLVWGKIVRFGCGQIYTWLGAKNNLHALPQLECFGKNRTGILYRIRREQHDAIGWDLQFYLVLRKRVGGIYRLARVKTGDVVWQ